jgi:predicted AAA+ superfamily ATPase
MQRNIQKFLENWKQSPIRLPLILQGARQTGKTWSLLAFGRDNYENTAYLNFETDPRLSLAFEESLDPQTLIPQLSRLAGETIVKEKTLVILDEIQLCEKAVSSLKYFAEQAPEYHIAAAGSLLGVALNRTQFSFPVGKVEIKTLYPMNMEEFLLAMGEAELAARIRECYGNNTPLPAVLHDAALSRYRQYLAVGGMPDCVKKYQETGDTQLVRHTQDMILASYINDMSKYNSAAEIKKVHQVYDNITVQLSRENTRFKYKLVASGGRAAAFEDAIEWLRLAGLIHRVYCVDQPMKPLENYRNIDNFKIYLSDTGLLLAKKDLAADDILFNSPELNDFKGGLTENYVLSQLIANEHRAYYWASRRSAEVDFIVQLDRALIPIEVKSAENNKSKSLDVYMNAYQPDYAIRMSAKNFGFKNKKKAVPLYAAFCL